MTMEHYTRDESAYRRLLEILTNEGKVYWEDRDFSGSRSTITATGGVEFLGEHVDGPLKGGLTFSCGDWSHYIGPEDGVTLAKDNRFVIVRRTAGSGRRWMCIYAPADLSHRASEVLEDYIYNLNHQ